MWPWREVVDEAEAPRSSKPGMVEVEPLLVPVGLQEVLHWVAGGGAILYRNRAKRKGEVSDGRDFNMKKGKGGRSI